MNFLKYITEYKKESKFSEEDILNAIRSDRDIYIKVLFNDPKHNPNSPVTPLSYYEGDLIIRDSDGNIGSTKLKFVSDIL